MTNKITETKKRIMGDWDSLFKSVRFVYKENVGMRNPISDREFLSQSFNSLIEAVRGENKETKDNLCVPTNHSEEYIKGFVMGTIAHATDLDEKLGEALKK